MKMNGINNNLTQYQMFGGKKNVKNYLIDGRPFPEDESYKGMCRDAYNGLSRVDFVDQCLINVGLARSYLNDFNRRQEEHRLMYPDIYKNELSSTRDMKAVATAPRPMGRGGMTQRMLERIATRQEAGLSAEEILCDIMQDPKQSIELRFRAASKIADLVYPKAASVEIEIDDNRLSLEEIDKRLMSLLSKNEKVIEHEGPALVVHDTTDVSTDKLKFLDSLVVNKVKELELFDNSESYDSPIDENNSDEEDVLSENDLAPDIKNDQNGHNFHFSENDPHPKGGTVPTAHAPDISIDSTSFSSVNSSTEGADTISWGEY